MTCPFIAIGTTPSFVDDASVHGGALQIMRAKHIILRRILALKIVSRCEKYHVATARSNDRCKARVSMAGANSGRK
jgi:hypothetical protein